VSLWFAWRPPSIGSGMTLRTVSLCLVVSGLLVTATVASAVADDSNASLQVSAQVVRSCRVTSDQPHVQVNCGSRPQAMQVTYDQPREAQPSAIAPTSVAPATARTVTIHF
jgi:hypothetical protein